MSTYLITNQQSLFNPVGYSFCTIEKCLNNIIKDVDNYLDSIEEEHGENEEND